jgi:hypothetical protein
MSDQEEYYRSKVQTILSDRKKRIDDAFDSIYEDKTDNGLKLICTILLAMILGMSIMGILYVF